MHIELSANVVKKLKLSDPADQDFIEHNKRFGDKVMVSTGRLTRKALDEIYDAAQAASDRGLMMSITSLRSVLDAPATAPVKKLNTLPEALRRFLLQDCIDGYLYSRDHAGYPMPHVVTEISYQEPRGMHGGPPSVVVELQYITMGKAKEHSIRFYKQDLVGKSAPQLLAGKGFFHETAELKALYEEHLATYTQFRAQYNRQFLCTGVALAAKGDYQVDKVALAPPGAPPARMVNDEEIVDKEPLRLHTNPEDFRELGAKSGFDTVPVHPYLYMFHLGQHRDMWVHVAGITPYVYQPELRDKLVLPPIHSDLLDVLVEDVEILMDDIVPGKSGGTVILCKGRPGVGKTLTAQVYSEISGKVLYQVHSGQLGVEPDQVEANLLDVLQRSQRWGAICLIDEADVFIAERGTDMAQNAVCAAFLRHLEGFAGVLFMTTNRVDNVDDAILNRCIAVIEYDLPIDEACRRLWSILGDQYKVPMPQGLIDQLMAGFGCLSGRDIKSLLKLVSKFSRKKKLEATYQVFVTCSQFRGITAKQAQ